MEIEGYENYLIYEDGRVYSKESKIFLKPSPDKDGYLIVGLYKDGKRKIFKIHRLVSLHYIPNPNNYECVDHKDRNRQNNSIDNLRWCSYSTNNQNTGVQINNKLKIKNISPHGNGYMFVKNMKGKSHRKRFKTLDEALKYKEEYLSNL